MSQLHKARNEESFSWYNVTASTEFYEVLNTDGMFCLPLSAIEAHLRECRLAHKVIIETGQPTVKQGRSQVSLKNTSYPN